MKTTQITTTQITAAALIDRSVSHTEVTRAEYKSDLAADLLSACDDHVSGAGIDGSVTEYWGTTESGSEWRVHLAKVGI